MASTEEDTMNLCVPEASCTPQRLDVFKLPSHASPSCSALLSVELPACRHSLIAADSHRLRYSLALPEFDLNSGLIAARRRIHNPWSVVSEECVNLRYGERAQDKEASIMVLSGWTIPYMRGPDA